MQSWSMPRYNGIRVTFNHQMLDVLREAVYIYSMPAIRYLHNHYSPIAGANPDSAPHAVEVAGKEGEPVLVSWMGFICMAGTQYLEGRMCKLFAQEVTNGDGGYSSQMVWKKLKPDEKVLGWLIPYPSKSSGFAVYGVVDVNGWPIIFKDRLPPGPKPKAEVKRLRPRESKELDRKSG